MDKTNIIKWCVDISLAWLMLLVLVILTKVASDFLTTPNIFITAKAEVLNQKQTDDMCVKWWTETDLTAAKKRVCGK
jgi:hypothetical protein